MLNHLLDVTYSSLRLGDEVEKYSCDNFSFPNGEFAFNNGIKYHYLRGRKNNSSKPVVIFLHGIMINSNIWSNYLDEFEEDYSVYALDFLGHGLSFKKQDLTLADLVDQLDCFIKLMEFDEVILVGHSLGGFVANMYAALRTDKVKAMALISTVDYEHMISDLTTHMNSIMLDFLSPFMNSFTTPLMMETLAQQIYNNKISMTDPSKEPFTYHVKIKGVREAITSLMKNYTYDRFSPVQYSKLLAKTLIIHGNKDNLIHYDNALSLNKRIPDSKLVTIEKGSHMIIEEHEEEVIHILEGFLKEL